MWHLRPRRTVPTRPLRKRRHKVTAFFGNRLTCPAASSQKTGRTVCKTVAATGRTDASPVFSVALTAFPAGLPPAPGKDYEEYKPPSLPLSPIFRTFAQAPVTAGAPHRKTEFLLVVPLLETEHFEAHGTTGRKLILMRTAGHVKTVAQGVWAIACYVCKACSEPIPNRVGASKV